MQDPPGFQKGLAHPPWAFFRLKIRDFFLVIYEKGVKRGSKTNSGTFLLFGPSTIIYFLGKVRLAERFFEKNRRSVGLFRPTPRLEEG